MTLPMKCVFQKKQYINIFQINDFKNYKINNTNMANLKNIVIFISKKETKTIKKLLTL